MMGNYKQCGRSLTNGAWLPTFWQMTVCVTFIAGQRMRGR